MNCKSLKLLSMWHHNSTIAKSTGVQSYATAHNTTMSPLYINCELHQSRENSNFAASQFPASLLIRWQHDARFPAYLMSSDARLIDPQLLSMDSAARALLILNEATNMFPSDIACEQLLAFPVINGLIKGLDQQFSMSLAKSHYLTCREFIRLSIEGYGLLLSTLFFVALLSCDENSCEH